MDDTATWKLIHEERAAIADTLTTLTAAQWATPSLCGGWSVRETAAHIVLGAEQTTPHFLGRMAANGFRFNTMMDRDARRKKRIDGLRLVATDVDWSHGTGPEVTGPAMPIVMAMTGRAAGLDELGGEGLATLRRRMTPTK
jgi:mycothiol maleylpyruvate isomerase-like protein